MRTCASVKSLMQIKDVTKEDALSIRKIWLTPILPSKRLIDAILTTHGVEYLGQHKRTGSHIWYCNAGDTYATTILFLGEHLRVGCWGDLAERDMFWEANDERRPGWPR